MVRPGLWVDGGPERLCLDGVDGELHPHLVPLLALQVVLCIIQYMSFREEFEKCLMGTLNLRLRFPPFYGA